MKAFLINPTAQTITEVEHDGSLKDIHKHIEADCFDVARLAKAQDGIFVDDDGLYKGKPFFKVENLLAPLAGNGLVLGTDDEGESISPATTLEELQQQITFISREQAIEMAEKVDEMNREAMEIYGERFIAIPIADIIRTPEYTDPSE